MTAAPPRPPARRAERPARVALVLAALWAAGLLVAAVTAPAYRGISSSSTSTPGGAPATVETTTSTATLVEENGVGVLAVVAIPLVAVVAVALALARRRRRALPGAGPVAWTVVALLGGFTFLALLTIGIFVVPVAGLLVYAAARA